MPQVWSILVNRFRPIPKYKVWFCAALFGFDIDPLFPVTRWPCQPILQWFHHVSSNKTGSRMKPPWPCVDVVLGTVSGPNLNPLDPFGSLWGQCLETRQRLTSGLCLWTYGSWCHDEPTVARSVAGSHLHQQLAGTYWRFRIEDVPSKNYGMRIKIMAAHIKTNP